MKTDFLNNMKKLLLLLILSGCMFKDGHYIDDNPVEEIAEGIIDSQLHVNIDLTPSTPEK